MAKTSVISKEVVVAPVERILGRHARIMNRVPASVNKLVHAEWIDVSFEEDTWPDEHARINLFPIADGQYCLQLLYLQYTEQPGNATVLWVEFRPDFFEQYPLESITAGQPFSFDKITEQQFTICTQTNALLQQLEEISTPANFIKSLEQTEIITHLLRRALQCIAVPFTACPVPACRFLAYDSEREKIIEAVRLVNEHLDKPFTIKELSKKVAMNECYLKKGFKAMTGKAIHEYTQELRIGRAKEMLKQPGFSVSDVANSLGYSSISHFSTAFKKATGMKPCELLA